MRVYTYAGQTFHVMALWLFLTFSNEQRPALRHAIGRATRRGEISEVGDLPNQFPVDFTALFKSRPRAKSRAAKWIRARLYYRPHFIEIFVIIAFIISRERASRSLRRAIIAGRSTLGALRFEPSS